MIERVLSRRDAQFTETVLREVSEKMRERGGEEVAQRLLRVADLLAASDTIHIDKTQGSA